MKMKIAFYVHSLTKGGAERAVANIASYLAKSNENITVITSVKNESEYELGIGVKRVILSDKAFKSSYDRYMKLIIALRREIKKSKYDIVIPFMSGATIRTIIASLGYKNKIITSVRNDPNYEYSGFIGKICAKIILPMVDFCVFQTEDARQFFPNRLKCKSIIIPNAVNDRFFNRNHKPKLGTIVTCGRLAKQKNQMLLIDAFSEIVKKYPEFKLFIYGIGEEFNNINQRILEKQLEKSVFLMGESDRIEEIYESADIFVLSSDFEGMPNALMEAMAVGVPCISTDCPCGGPRMLIKNNQNGVLVPVDDVQSMSNAIVNLINNPGFKSKIGKEASMSMKNYSLDKVCAMWLQVIEMVASKNRGML